MQSAPVRKAGRAAAKKPRAKRRSDSDLEDEEAAAHADADADQVSRPAKQRRKGRAPPKKPPAAQRPAQPESDDCEADTADEEEQETAVVAAEFAVPASASEPAGPHSLRGTLGDGVQEPLILAATDKLGKDACMHCFPLHVCHTQCASQSKGLIAELFWDKLA